MRYAAIAAAAAVLVLAAPAVAEPTSGPREDVDQSFTTTQPGAPTGIGFSGSYHAAGDPNGNPPYMRRMLFQMPQGFQFDTSAPERCTATDIELEAQGPAACPAGSHIGDGTTQGIFYAPLTHSFVFDRFQHHMDVMNNDHEQILLVHSEGWTVVRGEIGADNRSIDFHSPTCFPSPPTGCADDYVLQTKASSTIPAYTRTVDGQTRSYATTPATCPASGYWTTTISYWWADGTTDVVGTPEACSG